MRQTAIDTVAPGLLIVAGRTGFTRTEMLGLPLRKFYATLKHFLKRG